MQVLLSQPAHFTGKSNSELQQSEDENGATEQLESQSGEFHFDPPKVGRSSRIAAA